MTMVRRLAAMSAAGMIVVVVSAGSAFGADGTGRDYAEHVRMCQQAMGFSGTHNPGVMHHGYSGWHAHHAC